MSRTYRLCATAIDTMGREVMVRSQVSRRDKKVGGRDRFRATP